MEQPCSEAVYRRSPDFIFRRIADECVLVPVRQRAARLEAIYTLNEVGAHIWEHLDGRATIDDLVASVVATFDVQPEQARKDLLRFVRALGRAGAVVRVDGVRECEAR